MSNKIQVSLKVGENIFVLGGENPAEFEANVKGLFGDEGWALVLSEFEDRVRGLAFAGQAQAQPPQQQAQQQAEQQFQQAANLIRTELGGVPPGLGSVPPQQYQNPYPQQGGYQQQSPQQQGQNMVVGNDPMTGAPITYHPDGKYGPYYKVPNGGPGGKDLLANVPKWDRGKPASLDLALKAIQNRRDYLAGQGQM